MAAKISREALQARVGEEIGASDWFEMTQQRISAFADVTDDWQFIHLDPDLAAQTPFGGTIAHGYLTLSMLSAMAYSALPGVEGMQASVNYGFDSVRFVAPVRSGTWIRGRFVLQDVSARQDSSLMGIYGVTVEIEGQDRPALTAIWRILYLV